MAEVEKDERDGRKGDGRVNEAAAQENAETIREITHRLGQERIDLPFADVAGDLPFVLGRHDEIADEEREQIIIDHRAIVVTVQAAAAFVKNGAPKKDRAGEGNQTEEGAQEILPAIHERVLEPDVKDRNVLVDLRPRARAHTRNLNRNLVSTSTITRTGNPHLNPLPGRERRTRRAR